MKKHNLITFLLIIIFIITPFILILSSHVGTLTVLVKDGLVIIVIFWLFMEVFKERTSRITVIDLILFMWVLYGLIHVFFSYADLSQALNKFRTLYFYPIVSLLIIIYFRKWKLNAEKVLHIVINIFFIQALVILSFAVLEYFIGDNLLKILYQEKFYSIQRNLLGEQGIRLVSLLYNPIILGVYLNIFVVFLLYKKINLYFKISLIFLSIGAILFTYSRISYVILLVTFLIYFLMNYKMIFRLRFWLIITIIFLALIKLDISFNSDSNIVQRLQQLDISYFKDNVRFQNWSMYLENASTYSSFSLVWGAGLGTSDSDSANQSEYVKRVENSYISYLGELGIIGLFLFFVLLLRCINNIFKIYKYNKNTAAQLLQIIVILVIASFANDTFHNNPFSLYFWMIYIYSEIFSKNLGREK